MSPRPKRNRQLEEPPIVAGFVPKNDDYDPSEEVILHMEEYEAIRLSDYLGLTQLESSKRLQVSRPTFTRIYDLARKKVAKAFVENKGISIEGGDVVFRDNWYNCNHCHSVFKVSIKNLVDDSICPVCHDHDVSHIQDSGNRAIVYGNRKRRAGSRNKGVEGNCICPKCDYQLPHKAGVPCSSFLCPVCNIRMIRQNSEHHKIILNKRKLL